MGNLINTILSSITSIWNFIKQLPNAINALADWTGVNFGIIFNFANSLANEIGQMYNNEVAYAYGLFVSLANTIDHAINVAETYADNAVNSIIQWVVNTTNDLTRVVSQWLTDLENYIGQVIAWVYNNIVTPFTNWITQILNWIATVGAYMYNLLTHPDLLALFLGKYILLSWMQITKKLAPPFFKWFYASSISLIPDFEGLFEEIISSLFD